MGEFFFFSDLVKKQEKPFWKDFLKSFYSFCITYGGSRVIVEETLWSINFEEKFIKRPQ